MSTPSPGAVNPPCSNDTGHTSGLARRCRWWASRGGRTCLAACLLACGSALAAPVRTPTNDYEVIVERNLFGLRPLPAPPAGPEPEPPPKITLTGITTILGDKEVLMKVQMPSHPPELPQDKSLVQAEGQSQGGIRVLAINLKTDDVTIDDFGKVVTLNLEKDGAKLNTPPQPAQPPLFRQTPATRRWPISQFPVPGFHTFPTRSAPAIAVPKPDRSYERGGSAQFRR